MQKLLSLSFVLAALCPAVALAAPKCPNVLIVLDKSGSMADNPDDSVNPDCESNSDCSSNLCSTSQFECITPTSKITIAHQVISQVMLGGNGLQPPPSLVRFGFTDFPSDDDCGASYYNTNLLVKVNYGTESQIASTASTAEPGGATPTGPMLQNLLQDPSMSDASRPRYVVIVTDGEPTCGFSTHASDDPDTDAVTAVQSLRSAGVETFVVGFGTVGSGAGAGATTLNEMAAAGSPDAGAFSATDANSLASALSGIIQIASQGGELGGTTVSCDPCPDIVCPSGQTCNSTTGACQVDPYAPCEGSPCGEGQYCRVDDNGSSECAVPCATACPSGQICGVDGNCAADPCANGACSTCPAGQVHDGSGSGCVFNQCGSGIVCPGATFCTNNTCAPLFSGTSTTGTTGATTGGATTTTSNGTTGSTGKSANGNVTSSGGCSTTDGAALAGLGLLALAVFSRRRRA